MRKTIMLLSSLMLTLIVAISLSSCSDTKDDDWGKTGGDYSKNVNANDISAEPALARLEFPNITTLFGKPITTRTALRIYTTGPEGINFSVLWDCDKKAQRWSAYQMTKNMKSSQNLRGTFEEDPELYPSYRVKDSKSLYLSSVFERGHICPSADRQYSEEANQQTYYYTNMQPQYHMFNSGVVDNDWSRTSPWLRLENKVRLWAKGSDVEVLYVVKGGTIEDDQLLKEQPRINGQLPVPGYFFVALLLKNSQSQPYRAIGFLIPHDNVDHADDALSSYARNIRQLEQETGFDFFCNLPDDVEEHVETLPLENVLRAWKP